MSNIKSLKKFRNKNLAKKLQKIDDKKFEVRDLRQPEWHWIDNVFVDIYSRLVGHCASLVYFRLCRHADLKQRSWPAIPYLADQLGYSTRWITQAIKSLEQYHIIKVIRSKGIPNIYVLLNRSKWRKTKAVPIRDKEVSSEFEAGIVNDPMAKVWDDCKGIGMYHYNENELRVKE